MVPEDEQMTTRIRKGFKGVASMAAAGLLAVLSMTTATEASAGARDTAAWLGRMTVTAPVVRSVAKAAIANLGSMTVTATRVSTVARATSATTPSTGASSTGETEGSRAKSPRAVLVQ